MTTLRHPPLDQFVTRLQARFDLSTLVETGTFEGESTLYAAERFDRVVTIDICVDHHAVANARCAGHRNIEFNIGDTRVVLPAVVASLDQPALFWLDAHAAPGLFGDADDWPVLTELEIINSSPLQHFILIDDAHCFLPGSPHPACPTFAEVEACATSGGYACRVSHDVIAMVPRSQAQELIHFEKGA
jgi:hypothetical protein